MTNYRHFTFAALAALSVSATAFCQEEAKPRNNDDITVSQVQTQPQHNDVTVSTEITTYPTEARITPPRRVVVVQPADLDRPTGIEITAGGAGAMFGKTDGSPEWAVTFDGHSQAQSSNGYVPRGFGLSSWLRNQVFYNYKTGGYSVSDGRLEFGTGVGITFSERSGSNVLGGLAGGNGFWSHIAPFIGVHPFDLQFSLNTKHAREDFIEWNILGAGGLQVGILRCKGTAGALFGGSLGTLGSGGARWAEGATAQVTCPDFAMSADILRLNTSGRPVDIPSFTVSIPAGPLQLNLRGEAIITYNGDKSVPLDAAYTAVSDPNNAIVQKIEQRGFILLGGRLPGEPAPASEIQ